MVGVYGSSWAAGPVTAQRFAEGAVLEATLHPEPALELLGTRDEHEPTDP